MSKVFILLFLIISVFMVVLDINFSFPFFPKVETIADYMSWSSIFNPSSPPPSPSSPPPLSFPYFPTQDDDGGMVDEENGAILKENTEKVRELLEKIRKNPGRKKRSSSPRSSQIEKLKQKIAAVLPTSPFSPPFPSLLTPLSPFLLPQQTIRENL